MRIIGGELKGSNLYTPKDKNTRPLKNLARESIFNLLMHSKKIQFQFEDSNILDLYAGTGSFGLECLSRKAKEVYFVENKKQAIEVLEKNIKKLNLKKKTKVFYSDALSLITKRFTNIKFNLVFFDPPFKDNNISKLIDLIANNTFLYKNNILIFHRKKDSHDKFPDYVKILDERTYGLSRLIFGKILF